MTPRVTCPAAICLLAAALACVVGSLAERAAPAQSWAATAMPEAWTQHRVNTSLQLDTWVYATERLLHEIVHLQHVVVIVRDTPIPDAEARSHQLAVVEATVTATQLVATELPSLRLAYCSETINPFVQLGRYFGFPFGDKGDVPRHVVVGATRRGHRASPADGVWFESLTATTSVAQAANEVRSVVRKHGAAGDVQLSDTRSSADASEERRRPRLLPCPRQFAIYIYPDNGTSILSETYLAFLDALRATGLVVTDPSEACLFVPHFDTTPIPTLLPGRGSMDWFGNGRPVHEWLSALPYWNGGRNHVVLDWTDSRARYYDAGDAVVLKSGYDTSHYRHGHDIAFPLLPAVLFSAVHRSVESFGRRPLLLSFKGTLWKRHLGVPPFDVRRHLLELHNGRDIIVADRYQDGSNKYDYADLLTSSRFGLVPRGGGLHSYRFIEVLAAGAIPVVLADDWVIPFQEVVDPSAYTVRVPERDYTSIPERLRALSAHRVRQLATNAHMVYETCFDTPVATAVAVLRNRLASLAADE